MDRRVTVSQARASLPDIVRRVAAGEEVEITRHGQVVAVVVRPDALRVRRADAALAEAAAIHDMLAAAGNRPLDTAPALSEARARAMIDDVQAARSRR